MLSPGVRILNFDNSLIGQSGLFERFHPKVSDLLDIGPSARLWLNKKTEKQIKKVVSSVDRHAITFLGSGDFHHISSLLIEQFEEPISVIVFDNHPDWDIMPPRTGCGSWVSRILDKPNIKKVILLGISSEDISTFNIQTGNLSSLNNGRLEIYPYLHEPTTVFFRNVPENNSIDISRKFLSSRISWKELGKNRSDEFIAGLISGLETKRVYISIDKDCLNPEFSLTNWEQGHLKLDELLKILKYIKDNTDIVGMDILGDYSQINIKGRIKSIFSRLDHPKGFAASGKPGSFINSVNDATNIKILELFLR